MLFLAHLELVPYLRHNVITRPEKNFLLTAKRSRTSDPGGGDLAVVYGIGRACHIAFWEPHFGVEFTTDEEWRDAEYRIGAELHPLTVEQNAITNFRSRTTQVPAYANTIGPGLFTRADYAIGGADGQLGREMQWQGLSLWVTLRHSRSRHIPSTWMPEQPGVLFFTRELAGPLTPETN
jgi:glucosamine-6-phosphate deaminase